MAQVSFYCIRCGVPHSGKEVLCANCAAKKVEAPSNWVQQVNPAHTYQNYFEKKDEALSNTCCQPANPAHTYQNYFEKKDEAPSNWVQQVNPAHTYQNRFEKKDETLSNTCCQPVNFEKKDKAMSNTCRCGQPANPGRPMCQSCFSKIRKVSKSNTCRCGQPANPGRPMCQSCFEKKPRICISCNTRTANPGFPYCSLCHREQQLSAGVKYCPLCKKRPANKGFAWCQSCYDSYNTSQKMCITCKTIKPLAGEVECGSCLTERILAKYPDVFDDDVGVNPRKCEKCEHRPANPGRTMCQLCYENYGQHRTPSSTTKCEECHKPSYGYRLCKMCNKKSSSSSSSSSNMNKND
jgi:hypothetical protein